MLSKKTIIDVFKENPNKELTFAHIAKRMSLKGKQRQQLGQILAIMAKEGVLQKTGRRVYRLLAREYEVTGQLQVHPRGFGFLLPDKEEATDVYIPAGEMGSALHNDRVQVTIKDAGGGDEKPRGSVAAVLERANQRVVGNLLEQGGVSWVQPLERRILHSVRVAAKDRGAARTGDIVACQVTAWPGEKSGGDKPMQGRVTEIYGSSVEPGGDILGILARLGVRMEWPQDVQEEVQKIPRGMGRRQIQKRWDLRRDLLVTIDGADARDLDDALSLEKLADGRYRLGVHIADVSHYVRPGSALDDEASQRGCSVYPVDRVVPMLPAELSNGLCSLTAGEDRLALSLLLELNAEGRVESYRLGESVIRVRHRLTYQEVEQLLQSGQGKGKEIDTQCNQMLRGLADLSRILRRGRWQRGALEFSFGEQKVVLDAEGRPVALERRHQGVADEIVEECMILANETVARHLVEAEAPGLFRVHARPRSQDLDSAREVLHNLGFTLPPGEAIKPKNMQKILRASGRRPEARLVHQLLLRTLPRAQYAPECEGHFGLAAPYYTHFTSPIRRYPDLVVHRVLKALLRARPDKEWMGELADKLPGVARQSTQQEQLATEAERESVQQKVVEYMQNHVGETFFGTVVGVTGFGLFVELDNGAEGLVHISSLRGDYYHFLADRLVLQGERTRKRWQLGDQFPVRLVRADVEARTLDMEPVAMAAAVAP